MPHQVNHLDPPPSSSYNISRVRHSPEDDQSILIETVEMINPWFFSEQTIITLFINAQDSLDNLIGQNVITWGCINRW